MVDSIINFIRSLVFPNTESRKRRISIEDDNSNRCKIRRISNSNMSSPNEDDWHSTSPDALKRRFALGLRPRARTNWSKENIIHCVDDDVTEVLKNKHKSSYMDPLKGKSLQFTSSTPNCSYSHRVLQQNGEDDVIFLGKTPSLNGNKLNENKQVFEYIKPYTSSNNDINQTKFNIPSNGCDADLALSNKVREIKAQFNFKRRRNCALNQSYRLDEKAKYKRLLSQAAPTFNIVKNSFSKYGTPCGKLFVSGRGAQMLNLAKANEEKKINNFIDLTSEENLKKPTKLSTKATILKVLDGFDNDPIVVKDSDSDVEVLPTPPSPKPDIQVERVNSLKKVIDTSESTHQEWLTDLIQTYRDRISKSLVEIDIHNSQKEKLSAVTSEVYTRRLEDQMVKCLKIKDAVLPVQLSKDTVFPELTDEDEARISAALNKRGNPSEILVDKFNIRVTRRDIQTLAGLNWLNDEVINFYMNLIIERGKLAEWPNAYAMNTFFYPKLQKSGHSSLKRWTRRVDIFSYDIIAVPIHLGVHWCMSIIDFGTKTIRYYDSMGGANRCCLELLLEYLREEHLDKKKVDYDVSDWTLESMIDIPQQMNGSDCGMFSCTFAEFLTRGARITFSQENMPYLRRKMVLEILNGELLIT